MSLQRCRAAVLPSSHCLLCLSCLPWQALKVSRKAQPMDLMSSIFGLDGIHEVWQTFARQRNSQSSVRPLYFVSLDVSHAYDSITKVRCIATPTPLPTLMPSCTTPISWPRTFPRASSHRRSCLQLCIQSFSAQSTWRAAWWSYPNAPMPMRRRPLPTSGGALNPRKAVENLTCRPLRLIVFEHSGSSMSLCVMATAMIRAASQRSSM